MKKFLLSTFLGLGAIASLSAQGLEFQSIDGKVLNGETYTYKLYEVFPYGAGKSEIYVEPDINIFCPQEGSIEVTAVANGVIQLCTGGIYEGQCLTGESVTQNAVQVAKDGLYPLLLDLSLIVSNEELEGYKIPEVTVEVTMMYNGQPDSAVTMTVVMGGEDAEEAGVEGLAADFNKVNVAGKTLNYSVDSPSTLTLYSLSGKTILNQSVSGKGSLSLNNLSTGVYLYRVSGKKTLSGKFIIK